MTRRILVVPTVHGSGTSTVCLGLVHALDADGVDVGFVKPLAQPRAGDAPDISVDLIRLVTPLDPPDPVDPATVRRLLASDDLDELMELALDQVEATVNRHDVVIVEGLAPSPELTTADSINLVLATTLDAEVVVVTSGRQTPAALAERVSATAAEYRDGEFSRIAGVILNRLPIPPTAEAGPWAEIRDEYVNALQAHDLRVLGLIPDQPALTHPRVRDVMDQLDLTPLRIGELDRRVESVVVAAQGMPGVLPKLVEGSLVVVPGDRSDVVLATALKTMNGTRLAGLLLSVGVLPDPRVMALCEPAAATGLPILVSAESTYDTVSRLRSLDPDIPLDDEERAQAVKDHVATGLDQVWLAELPLSGTARRLSPAAFRRQLSTLAAAADRRIVLPEGAEPRTVRAAVTCHRKGIARCVLLADPAQVRQVASGEGLPLPPDLEIIDPAVIAPDYVDALVERRRHKGMTADLARDELTDTVMLGTMMLAAGEVDGLVSGAVHTTANTVRPALQILGTKPGAELVSSVFFMCLPDEVVIYGDCAINPDPDATQLADIAIQSADSAAAFGITPRVAMISFSTGVSGAGADVEKVAAATRLVRERRPDVLVDGPLQYDAAAMRSVARSKAPDSPVAGQATVFVFPDLNTGNTTYKAVQRSARVISVGPMLQGIAKPVNDLSRGALVDDIVYTIALTAIQAAAD